MCVVESAELEGQLNREYLHRLLTPETTRVAKPKSARKRAVWILHEQRGGAAAAAILSINGTETALLSILIKPKLEESHDPFLFVGLGSQHSVRLGGASRLSLMSRRSKGQNLSLIHI